MASRPAGPEFGRTNHLKVPAGVTKQPKITPAQVSTLHDYKDRFCVRDELMTAKCVFTRLAVMYNIITAVTVINKTKVADANNGWGNGITSGLLQVYNAHTVDEEGKIVRPADTKTYEGKYLGSKFWHNVDIHPDKEAIKERIRAGKSSDDVYMQMISSLGVADMDGGPILGIIAGEVNRVWNESGA